MSIKLYEFAPTRSARVRWTLLELDIPFESRSDRALFGSDELKKVHPLGKLPAIEDDGRPLFESAAICSWLADKHPEKGLIAVPGSWDRALHDQWVAFILTEVEAHSWSSFRNTVVYPEDRRVPAIIEQNNAEIKRSLAVLDHYLSDKDYLIANRFSVTDIIAGYEINGARRNGHLEDFRNLQIYTERLLDRPLCPYSKE